MSNFNNNYTDPNNPQNGINSGRQFDDTSVLSAQDLNRIVSNIVALEKDKMNTTDNVVQTRHILKDAITTEKINDSAVTENKLAKGIVSRDKFSSEVQTELNSFARVVNYRNGDTTLNLRSLI